MEKYDCWICKDQGIICYRKNGCEYACSCTCVKGLFVSKNIPSIEKVADPEKLAKMNIMEYSSLVKQNTKSLRKEVAL